MNILEQGFTQKSQSEISIDILLMVSDGKIRIRLRDNAVSFNPLSRLKLYTPTADDPCANIGIRIVAGFAEKMEYKSIAGMNILNIVI